MSLILDADATKDFVLNFEFWKFEFVSNFDIRISDLLYVIYGRL
jgi:hypothetical protein